MKTTDHPIKTIVVILCAFSAAYLAVIFPFAYFRHDDWIILGNAMRHVTEGWRFAFSSTLFFGGEEEVWFFRPFFKLICKMYYDLFGLNYYLWLTLNLAMLVASLVMASSIVSTISGQKRKGALFAILFAASVHIHFGSLIWVGEGLMNVPQTMFLIFNVFALLRSFSATTPFAVTAWRISALVAFIVSLGFKEAGVFHSVLLVALFFGENKTGGIPPITRLGTLVPYFVVAPIYLIYRLLFLPINPGYLPQWTIEGFMLPAFYIFGSIAIPVGITLLFVRFSEPGKLAMVKRRVISRWLYAPFLLLTIAPYFGHPFFSPGWLIYPGFYSILLLVLCLPDDIDLRKLGIRAGLVTFVVSAVLVGYRLGELGWFYWRAPQREIVRIVNQIAAQPVTHFIVEECQNPDFPESNMPRVVASGHGLFELWSLVKGSSPKILFVGCQDGRKREIASAGEVRVRWRFPVLELVTPPRLP